MYYLYKKSKSVVLPNFHYSFKGFEDFYQLASVIDVPLEGVYYINIKTDSYSDLAHFIDNADSFGMLVIYIESPESLIKYIRLKKPNVRILDSKSNWEIFEELITKHEILFKHKCASVLYYAIPHTYEDINAALAELKMVFPGKEIGVEEISQLYPIDTNTYPRQVLISFLRLERGMWARFEKCVSTFGNDLVLFSMRKANNKFLDDKLRYLKSGEGDYLIKSIPWQNIVKMQNVLMYSRKGFMDIRTLLQLYMRGETVNDYLLNDTAQYSDD